MNTMSQSVLLLIARNQSGDLNSGQAQQLKHFKNKKGDNISPMPQKHLQGVPRPQVLHALAALCGAKPAGLLVVLNLKLMCTTLQDPTLLKCKSGKHPSLSIIYLPKRRRISSKIW